MVRIHSGVPIQVFPVLRFTALPWIPLPQRSFRHCAQICAHPEPRAPFPLPPARCPCSGERSAGSCRSRCAPRNTPRCTGPCAMPTASGTCAGRCRTAGLDAGKFARLAVPLYQGGLFHVAALGGSRKTHSESATDFRMSSRTAARFGNGIDRRAFAVFPKGIWRALSRTCSQRSR